MSTKTLELRKTQKFTFLKIQKTQNTGYIQNNGTEKPEINTAIRWFTQSRSTEYWLNIVTAIFKQYSNTILLIWYFYTAFSEDVNEDFWDFEKHKNLHFSKSKKHKTQGTYENNGTGESIINNSICRFTQSHSTKQWLNVFTTIFNQQTGVIMLNRFFYNLLHHKIEIYVSSGKTIAIINENSSSNFRKNSWKMTNRQYSHHWYQQHANIV